MPGELIGRGWAFPMHIGAQGGLALSNETSELDQSINIILSTTPGERVMRTSFGSRLHELLFEPCNARTLSLVVEYTREALSMWEPRIEINDIIAYQDSWITGRILIEIEYTAKNSNDPRSLVYPFYTIPDYE